MISLRWVLLLLLVAACGSSAPKLALLDANAVVLAFGDSLTFGTGANPTESYPAVLERSIGRKVVNAGVPGETSGEGLERLPGVLEEVRPKLLILCHGGNDFLRKMDEAKAAENIRAMVKLARSQGVAVVLMATPKPGLPPSIPAFYAQMATELSIPFEEGAVRAVVFDNRLKSDLIHPNAQGYAQIAAALQKVLKNAGAI